jgi:hypothetical protein
MCQARDPDLHIGHTFEGSWANGSCYVASIGPHLLVKRTSVLSLVHQLS